MTTHSKPSQTTRVALLFGGKSAEHEISIQSAGNIAAALDRNRFELVLIGIDKQGGWHRVARPSDIMQINSGAARPDLTLLEGVDVVFPVLHGPMGEDGTVQGLLELLDMPYVGPNVLSSAVGMDKDVMKRLLRDADVAIAPFITVVASMRTALDPHAITGTLGLPVFVKPANMGSSIGVSRVTETADLMPAIDEALRFDSKVLVESAVVGDEIECAVLGNDQPRASTVGHVIARDGFYSYNAKYHDEKHETTLEIPAALPPEHIERARETALKTYQVLGCEGLARVDMFVRPNGGIVVNEVNTLPGFTAISMYPKLWEASGVGYTELITRLIELALERADRRSKLQTTYS